MARRSHSWPVAQGNCFMTSQRWREEGGLCAHGHAKHSALSFRSPSGSGGLVKADVSGEEVTSGLRSFWEACGSGWLESVGWLLVRTPLSVEVSLSKTTSP